MDDEQLMQAIEIICRSKIEEFELLGYEHVGVLDIWSCISKRYHRLNQQPALHQVVSDIMTLKPQELMNYLTVRAWQEASFE